MDIFRNILLVVYLILGVVVILVTTFQNKDSKENAEDTYENKRTNKYLDKNKSRTKSGKIQKNTIILGVLFTVLTIVTTVVWAL